MRFSALLAIISVGIVNCPPALSMTFNVINSDKYQWIDGFGTIEEGDIERFRNIIHDDTRERVLSLDSPGGNLAAALALGREVRTKKFSVYLPPSGSCYSACFFVFISGIYRSVSDSAKLGVHQFAGTIDGESADSAQGTAQNITAELIQFSVEMGAGIETIQIALKTPPGAMYVFSKAELSRYKLLGKSELVSYGTTYRDGCPFPQEFDLQDPMNLYPDCH